jgi:hypothetical protein
LAIGLLELLLHRKAGRLTIGRRMPSCPTSAQPHSLTSGETRLDDLPRIDARDADTSPAVFNPDAAAPMLK